MNTQMLITDEESQQFKSRLSKKQSLALVQIFLNTSFACICHVRELIPWTADCFRTRQIDQVRLHRDHRDLYQAFCGDDTQQPGISQEIKVLVRSSVTRANRLLDLIEQGVFDAIEHEYLHSLRVFVARNAEDASSVLEAYTFSFTYSKGIVASIGVNDNQEVFCLAQVQKSFKSTVRMLLRSLNRLPRLPRHRTLGISLVFNDASPPTYQPPGFTALNPKPDNMQTDWSKPWHETSTLVNQFETEFFCIEVGAGGAGTRFYPNSTQQQDWSMSRQLQKMQKSSVKNVDITSTQNVAVSASVPVEKSKTSAALQPLSLKNSEDYQVRASADDTENSIASPRRTNLSTLETTTKLPDQNFEYKTSQTPMSLEHCPGWKIKPTKLAEMLVQAYGLSSTSLDGELFDKSLLRNGSIRRLKRSHNVKCECRSGMQIPDMLYCELCDSWQHMRCYGFLDGTSRLIHDQHFCYECLLLPKDQEVYNDILCHVPKRLAIIYISNQPNLETRICDELVSIVCGDRSNEESDFVRTINELLREGIVEKWKDKDGLSLRTDEDRLGQAKGSYLDPLFTIKTHYQPIRERLTSNHRKLVDAALTLYTDGRDYERVEGCDETEIEGLYERRIKRWRYHVDSSLVRLPLAGLKRKISSEEGFQNPNTTRRRMSISRDFIDLDHSSPQSGLSLDEAFENAVNEAEWDIHLSEYSSPTTAKNQK